MRLHSEGLQWMQRYSVFNQDVSESSNAEVSKIFPASVYTCVVKYPENA
jgi:CRISPR/Cas system-associated endoribonuclease Cas2